RRSHVRKPCVGRHERGRWAGKADHRVAALSRPGKRPAANRLRAGRRVDGVEPQRRYCAPGDLSFMLCRVTSAVPASGWRCASCLAAMLGLSSPVYLIGSDAAAAPGEPDPSSPDQIDGDLGAIDDGPDTTPDTSAPEDDDGDSDDDDE